MNFIYPTVTWSGSATSAAVDLYSKQPPMALITPASFGATSITFEAATTFGGTYTPVYDETGAAITITVSSTNAGWYDLTNIFPASVQFVKLVASASITKTATLVGRDAN